MKIELDKKLCRCVKRFAILPIVIDRDLRWLETVYILQKRLFPNDLWINMSFITKEEYEVISKKH